MEEACSFLSRNIPQIPSFSNLGAVLRRALGDLVFPKAGVSGGSASGSYLGSLIMALKTFRTQIPTIFNPEGVLHINSYSNHCMAVLDFRSV